MRVNPSSSLGNGALNYLMRATGSRIARILALSGLLSTIGCTLAVMDRYQSDAMTPSLWFRVDGIETPEVRVTWVHRMPLMVNSGSREEKKVNIEKQDRQSRDTLEDRPILLTIRPELEDCQVVEVFLNGEPLDATGEWKRASAISDGEVLVPAQDDPKCSLMLTFRRMDSPRTFSIVAATKNGVVAEFPDGKREHAWLLMFPPAIIGDVVVAAITVAVATPFIAGYFLLLILAEP